MKIKYKLKEITDNVFLCTIKDSYDLTMTFCRAQEFYESHFKEIRGKKFTILEFIKLYTQWSTEGAFTYTTDWVGFNLPSSSIENMFKLGIDDFNEYDDVMYKIHNGVNREKYYLIAGCHNNTTTIDHELCHAFYFLDKQYKKETDKLCKKLLPTVYKKIERRLFDIGYCKKVIKDEIQAYLSTDIGELEEINFNKKEQKNFKNITVKLEKHLKQVKQGKNIKI